MHKLETAILHTFKNNPEKEFSTEDLVELIFSEYAPSSLHASKEDLLKTKRFKAQLHRKLLYHLNKLVEDNILKITKVIAKGQKCFSLALEEGELIIGKSHKKIIITKSTAQAMPIEGYEQKGIVQRFGGDSWAIQLNALLLEGRTFQGINKLQAIMMESFSTINDVIAINNFESLIETTGHQEMLDFLKKLSADAKDYNRKINLIIHTESITKINMCLDFIRIFSSIHPDSLEVIFDTNANQLNQQAGFFEHVAHFFSENKIKIHLKNSNSIKAPFLVGNAGVYTFDEAEWKEYASAGTKTIGLVCSQASIVIDHYRFFQHYKTDAEYRMLMINVLKSLVVVNTLQRRKADDYFKRIIKLNEENSQFLFNISRNYLRFWNYDLVNEDHNVVQLLKSCKDLVADFCHTQETIFASCGIPFHFSVAFSSAFKKFDEAKLSERMYRKTSIKKRDDFYAPEIQNVLKVREDLLSIFEGGDRVRFFRSGDAKPKDIVQELITLVGSFHLPFICYDFSTLKGTLTLQQFME